MTTVKLSVTPHQTPAEEAALIARVARAVADSTGDDTVAFELITSEQVSVTGEVAERMSRGARWTA